MTQKTFRPATSWGGERAGTDHSAWQQISAHSIKASPLQQEFSITSYRVDDRLNVVGIKRGPHLREVRSW